ESELGDERHADARSDESLHRLEIVALERDARLESGSEAQAHEMTGARAARRGLHPVLGAQALQRERRAAGERMTVREGDVERVLEQRDRVEAAGEPVGVAREGEE